MTITCLFSLYRTNEQTSHLKKALENDVTCKQMIETLTVFMKAGRPR